MPTNPDSSEVSGHRKRTLSTKAATNGDLQAGRKRQKSDNAQQKLMSPTEKRAATTSHKVSSSKAAPAKAAIIAAKATARLAPAKLAP